MRRKIDDLNSEEQKMDIEIETLNRQLKEEFLENDRNRQYHYITFDDCAKICKAISKGNPQKSLVILSAPTGTTLEVDEEDHG